MGEVRVEEQRRSFRATFILGDTQKADHYL